MKKVSIRQTILNAIDDTDDNIARHMNMLIKWAKYCEKAIGSKNGYRIKSSLHTVTDGEIMSPDDCYKVWGIIPGDYTDQLNLRYMNLDTINVHVENVSDDLDFEWVWGDLSTTKLPSMLWEEIGDRITIVDQYEDTDVTLVYQFIEVGEDGYWLINETHVDAITKYLIYMYAKKFMFKNFKASKLTRQSDLFMLKMYKDDYSHAIRNARALDGEESPMNTIDR